MDGWGKFLGEILRKLIQLSFYLWNEFQRLTVVASNKIYSDPLFATNAQVDITSIVYSVSMATLYFSVNA